MRDATAHRIHGIADERGAEWVLHQPGVWTAPRSLSEALAADVAPRELAVNVSGNHGRWIVQCPDCNGAQLAAPRDHRFMCNVCANVVIGGLWRPVVWPRDPEKLATILNLRGAVDTRNYEPGETAAELRVQNDYLDAVARGEDHPGGPGIHPHHPGKASFWEGHTHKWPKTIKADTDYTCGECGEVVPGAILQRDRKAAS